MKNKLTDLNNHLFAQLERLSDEDLTGEQIADEVKRADAVVSVADQIVRNADLQLKAVTILANHGERVSQHLTMLEDKTPPALVAVNPSTWCSNARRTLRRKKLRAASRPFARRRRRREGPSDHLQRRGNGVAGS
jgi:hypothetical protein